MGSLWATGAAVKDGCVLERLLSPRYVSFSHQTNVVVVVASARSRQKLVVKLKALGKPE